MEDCDRFFEKYRINVFNCEFDSNLLYLIFSPNKFTFFPSSDVTSSITQISQKQKKASHWLLTFAAANALLYSQSINQDFLTN